MAYRFTNTSRLGFNNGPISGYTFGAFTMACFVQRTNTSNQHDIIFVATSAGNRKLTFGALSGGGGSTHVTWPEGNVSPNSGMDASNWMLYAVTCSGAGVKPRGHLHNGTSWVHATPVGGSNFTAQVLGSTELLHVSATTAWGGEFLNGDLVCAGLKKANSTDGQIETLSRTAFSAWAAFGFDWLIGFEASGSLVNIANPGVGNETSRASVTVVSDPARWSWATTPPVTFVPQIIIS